jgi:hypothetical protein
MTYGMPKSRRFAPFFMGVLLIILILRAFSGTAIESIEIQLVRDRYSFSSQNAEYIRGTFNVVGSTPLPLSWIGVYFNDELQANQTGNTISFRFETKQYEPGLYHIQIRGQNPLGELYTSAEIIITFQSEAAASTVPIILSLIGGFALIIVIVKKLRAKPSARITKEDVTVDRI